MTIIDEQGRPEPPLQADELGTLVGFLEFHRATLAWKVRGLDAAALATTVGPSRMTLGGLLKHLAYVEDNWFGFRLHGLDREPPWDTVDWSSEPDWDWTSAAADPPAALQQTWARAVARSRTLLDQALADGGLDQAAKRPLSDGQVPNLRWILTHMVEEYARHNGHADLLREAIDGQTGE